MGRDGEGQGETGRDGEGRRGVAGGGSRGADIVSMCMGECGVFVVRAATEKPTPLLQRARRQGASYV